MRGGWTLTNLHVVYMYVRVCNVKYPYPYETVRKNHNMYFGFLIKALLFVGTSVYYVQCIRLIQVIPGWDQGLIGVCKGEERHLVVPSSLAYGERGAGEVIPPHATLLFDIVIVDVEKVRSAEDIRREQEEEEQRRRKQQEEEEAARRRAAAAEEERKRAAAAAEARRRAEEAEAARRRQQQEDERRRQQVCFIFFIITY